MYQFHHALDIEVIVSVEIAFNQRSYIVGIHKLNLVFGASHNAQSGAAYTHSTITAGH
jgi:hypothetical protein